jgi:hypothetical protein
MIGGRRVGLGSITASSARQNRPSSVTRSPENSRRMISKDSSNLETR